MSSVYSDKFEGVAFRSGAELAQFEADAQALADVRTLDDWAKENKRPHSTLPTIDMAGYWKVSLRHDAQFIAPTPDGARSKAAAWVRSQKP